MPYIKEKDRSNLSNLTATIKGTDIKTAGELNYLLTELCLSFITSQNIDGGYSARYQNYNDIVGALEGCKLEFYRRAVAPYEDDKIHENGDVYPGGYEDEGN
jgi:hypothetical protein